jgi:hypothetical protein
MGAYFDGLRKAAKIEAPGFPDLVPAESKADGCKDACCGDKCEDKPAAK